MRFLALSCLAVQVLAQDVVYVTDLPIFTSLAPCAASAVSQVAAYQTDWHHCSESVSDLQSCICTERSDVVATSVSSAVSMNCGGSTASQDQSSASTVLEAYCSQDASIAFPTPKHLVSSYIYELPPFEELAPCASKYLSMAVQGNTFSACPPDPTALAPCACDKDQNSLTISQSVNSLVGAQCSNTVDVSSAQAVFSAYCSMNSGVTSFPSASDPPGDMSYYITDLNQYKSLDSCARSAIVTAVMFQTMDLCPTNGPQALASCVCIKDKVSKSVSSDLSSQARYTCQTNYMGNLASATDVLNLYCSAAKAQITEDVVLSSRTRLSGPTETGSDGSGSDDGKDNGPGAGVIAGATVGAVAGVLLGGLAVFCCMRRRRASTKKVLVTRTAAQDQERATVQNDQSSREEALQRGLGSGHGNPPAPDPDPISPPPYEEGSYVKRSTK